MSATARRARVNSALPFMLTAYIVVWLMIAAGSVPLAILLFAGWEAGDFRTLEDREYADLAALHQMNIVTPDGPVTVWQGLEAIRAEPAGAQDLQRFAPMLAQELALYPPDMWRRARLRRVVLCANLTMERAPAGGVAACPRSMLFIDISTLADDSQHARKTVHHELFHLLDYREEGELDIDAQWTALNRTGFRYSGRVPDVFGGDGCELTEDYPGFLNHYSTTALCEDKAEIFANMIVEPHYVQFRAKTDTIIRAKVARIKEIMAAHCPAIDQKFWQRIEKLERDEDGRIGPE